MQLESVCSCKGKLKSRKTGKYRDEEKFKTNLSC